MEGKCVISSFSNAKYSLLAEMKIFLINRPFPPTPVNQKEGKSEHSVEPVRTLHSVQIHSICSTSCSRKLSGFSGNY